MAANRVGVLLRLSSRLRAELRKVRKNPADIEAVGDPQEGREARDAAAVLLRELRPGLVAPLRHRPAVVARGEGDDPHLLAAEVLERPSEMR